MASLEEKQARVTEVTQSGYRGQLLARGQARGMIWREGGLPENAPDFDNQLSYDLLSYGYALLSDGLDILEGGGDPNIARRAFEFAADAIESVSAKGTENQDRDFHRFIAASAYHLARYTARAFSMLIKSGATPNLSMTETALSLLMLREIDALEDLISEFKRSGSGTDGALSEQLAVLLNAEASDDEEDSEAENILSVFEVALTDNFFSALATAMLAFERGDNDLLESARADLTIGMQCSSELNFIPQWWCHRLAIFLIGDLWESSFHQLLPIDGGDLGQSWTNLRLLFIASLFKRDRAEIDLWPSQVEAAGRALDVSDDLVISLPTSAGKTRIAELCILACLAAKKRIMFITPLRALSAQTEVSLKETFAPLGKTISSLYGSIGVGAVDVNILTSQDVIVATPEKLDFALRNDPDILNDVGLVVLDEGHMIGLGEREVRYEVQIQRLRQRADAGGRRIVCLSAILPDDDKLDDFVGWLTNDAPDGLIQKDWRPTRLRFGHIEWRGDRGWLELTVDDERPFVPRFIEQRAPTAGQRKALFPRDQRELCLAAAWRLVEDGQSVLIFCPLRKSVEPFADAIVDLHERGFLQSVLCEDPEILSAALTVGREWFDADHSILKCLELGIAVHHGALPTPFRREVERLLREGVLKITVSSPTLAQGLNLSATALIFHGLYRNGQPINVSEFRNVVGRAGRAFVDVEGLVLYPMYNASRKNKQQWSGLIADTGGKEMESGLVKLVQYLMARMIKKHAPKDMNKLREYVLNAAYWEFPEIDDEQESKTETAAKLWPQYISMLDTAIFGLIGDGDIDDADIETALDTILQSSLWARRLAHQKEGFQNVVKAGLVGRAKYLWSQTTSTQRKAYFLAGVGLTTGQLLDMHADDVLQEMIAANATIAEGDEAAAITAFVAIARILFDIPPFSPKKIPDNWTDILSIWLKGEPISSLPNCNDPEALQFIEDALIYRLPWGMEAVRVRALAHETKIGDGLTLDDLELGLAVSAIETGTLSVASSLLIKSGFNSRSAAIKVAKETEANFDTVGGLRAWLRREPITSLSGRNDWPTVETASQWAEFIGSFRTGRNTEWIVSEKKVSAFWYNETPPIGQAVRLIARGEHAVIAAPDYEELGYVQGDVTGLTVNSIRATVSKNASELDIVNIGPKSNE